MKRIYTITLDGDDPLYGNFKNDIRMIAMMVYLEIDDSYSYGTYSPLDKSKYLKRNKLRLLPYDLDFNVFNKCAYSLESDLSNNKKLKYEPFIVNQRTFAFTIVDDDFDEDKLRKIVMQVLGNLKLGYRIRIESFPYEAKDADDVRFRDKTVRGIQKVFLPFCGRSRTRKRKNSLFEFRKLGKIAI